MNYARIINGCAFDVRAESPEGCFTSNIVAEFEQVPDAVQNGWLLSGGVWAAPPAPAQYIPTAEEIAAAQAIAAAAYIAECSREVQATMEDCAHAHGYDNLISACSYAGAPNPFQSESVKFIMWRGDVWTKCHEVLNAVQAGKLAQPTVPELIAMLPGFPT